MKSIKLLLGLIEIIIIFAIVALAFLLCINKTFINENYVEDFMLDEGIPIPRFMYFENLTNDLMASFITPVSYDSLNKAKEEYLATLEKCYGRYYYDEKNAITIIDYDINNDKYLRKVSIKMANDNYCSEDYQLSDKWIYEYENLSLYVTGDITKEAMDSLVKKIYESEKVSDPIINDEHESTVSINVNASIESVGYSLTFKDFSTNELIVIKEKGNDTQFAVYEIENVIDYLNSLERKVES